MTFDDFSERALLLSGRMAARQLPRNTQIADLSEVEFRVFSQWGEDGIVEWLASHVPVPNHRFVEFGVESFSEANCRFLLQNRNWSGLVFDGSAENIARLRTAQMYWMYDLRAGQAFITVENINELIRQAGFEGDIGILSIDIDGNDYWVWKAIHVVSPAIVICEYNPILGDTAPLVIPYESTFQRLRSHHSGLYFGASIAALRLLADEKGYAFVGSCSNGINAFFVRTDLAGSVIPLLSERRAFPSKHRDSRDANGRLTFTGGLERSSLIARLPLVDLESGATVCLADISRPYSDDWLRLMDCR
jgi:hypothetical protein